MASPSTGRSEVSDSTTLLSSSSSTVTVSSRVRPSYAPPSALCVSVTRSSTASSSGAAVTVTVWAVFQLEELKVRVVVDRVRSVPPCPLTLTVTVSVGTCERRTV